MYDRVYRFGCKRPDQPHLAEQLLGQAWLYRDALRRVYNRYRRALRSHAEAEAESAHVQAWCAHEALTRYAAHVAAWHVQAPYQAFHDGLNAGIREVRDVRGHLLDCGTYWLLEAEALSAHKAATKHGNRYAPLTVPPFDLTGRIGAAIQSREQFDADVWPDSGRVTLTKERDVGRCQHRLTIFVGELKAGRALSWPIALHRPFPPGTRVKQVAVQAVRNGHRISWEALLTVGLSGEAVFKADRGARGVVGVDVGWRDEGDLGKRVSTHDGSDGDAGVLRIDTLRHFEYADAVEGTRDTVFNAAKEDAAHRGLGREGERIDQWRDKSRLHRRTEALANDEALAWWHHRDKHLQDISAGVRQRAVRRRLDAFRVYANDLAKRYQYVVLEDMPMADWVGEGETAKRERSRSSAGLYILQQSIAQRFGPNRVHWAPPQDSSRTCSDCGIVRPTSVGPAPRWTCECGREHHQDENAARVLRLWGERWIGDGNAPRARTRKALKPKLKPKAKRGKMSKPALGTVSKAKGARKAMSNAAE